MKPIKQIILFPFLLLLNSCIVQFIPETGENKDLLVVEGLITDQVGINTIKLSKALPLNNKNLAKPLKGCLLTISDDIGNIYSMKESDAGTYVTDPAEFQGTIGRKYILHININTVYNNLNYESMPMEMMPVPPIDSIYYEREIIREGDELSQAIEGCQIYLNTHDPAKYCKFYRWEYSETWEFRLPYDVTKRICWISSNSDRINIKNTSILEEDRIKRYPINFISNQTDKLKVKYTILVNQYSLNEDEFFYWEKLQNISENRGGLYDIIPTAIASNIWCIEDPGEKVLGYFSVSASSSKRIFIKDYFSGIVDLYSTCPADTIYGGAPIPNLNTDVWVIENFPEEQPPYKVLTHYKGCADCTVRGTNKEPVFWKESK